MSCERNPGGSGAVQQQLHRVARGRIAAVGHRPGRVGQPAVDEVRVVDVGVVNIRVVDIGIVDVGI